MASSLVMSYFTHCAPKVASEPREKVSIPFIPTEGLPELGTSPETAMDLPGSNPSASLDERYSMTVFVGHEAVSLHPTKAKFDTIFFPSSSPQIEPLSQQPELCLRLPPLTQRHHPLPTFN